MRLLSWIALAIFLIGYASSAEGVQDRGFSPKTPSSRDRRSSSRARTRNRCHKIFDITKRIADRYDLNTTFYQKYTSTYSIPIMSSSYVDDRALQRACYVARAMLADREDMRHQLYRKRGRFTVIASNQTIPMVPEMREYRGWRGRSVGGHIDNPVTIIGEEHLLCTGNDEYFPSQDILIHEIAHAVHSIAAVTAEPDLELWGRWSYQTAISKELWKNTYAGSSEQDYFAEGVQSYYNHQREGPDGGDGVQNSINTVSELETYDSNLYSIINQVFPCRNTIIPRCEDVDQEQGLKQEFRMNCDYDEDFKPVPEDYFCFDNHRRCETWADAGKCETDSEYMTKTCKESCGLCKQEDDKLNDLLAEVPESQIIGCVDAHEDCEYMEDYCSTNSKLRKVCKITCNICKPEEPNDGDKLITGQPINATRFDATTGPPDCSNETNGCKVTETTARHIIKASADCVDLDPNCPVWRNYCDMSYTMEKCKFTCDLCSPMTTQAMTTTPVCVDLDSNCPSWTKYCYRRYAQDNCKFTCGLCGPNATPVMNIPQPEKESQCQDLDSDCPIWTEYCWRRYAQENCKFTCGFCNLTKEEIAESAEALLPEKDCADLDVNCKHWTSSCSDNIYVTEHCQKTCKLCSPLQSTATAATFGVPEVTTSSFIIFSGSGDESP